MQKEIVTGHVEPTTTASGPWLDLSPLARVRLTSEEKSHPVESALQGGQGPGWRAAEPGRQRLWLHFKSPQAIQQIHLRFEVDEPRTQEFTLRWSEDGGMSYRELLRQQFNFSPGGARIEEENYFPNLCAVTDLELAILPDMAGGAACASLQELRLR